MADKSIIQKALDLARQGQEFVFPHASKNPLAPMAYVKDFNEFFLPSAQMALDEAAGEEEYPAWAYGLASIPVVGKVGKVAGKVAKKAGKGAAKAGIKQEADAIRNNLLEYMNEKYYNEPTYAAKKRYFENISDEELVRDYQAFNPKKAEGMYKGEWVADKDNIKSSFESAKNSGYKDDAAIDLIAESYGISSDEVRALLKEGQPSTEWTLVKDEIPLEEKIRYNFKKEMEKSRQPSPFTESDAEIFGKIADDYGISTEELEKIVGVKKPKGAVSLKDGSNEWTLVKDEPLKKK